MQRTSTGLSIIVLCTLMAVGCVGRKDLGLLTDTDTDTGGGSGDTGNGDVSGSMSGTATGTNDTGPMLPPPRAVDILFVVDNTGSMGEEQGQLSRGIDALTGVLMGAQLSFRIGVTTTDNGNPWCTGTSPEAGALRTRSCRARQAEFEFHGSPMVDATQVGCLDVCDLEEVDIAPSVTDPEPVPKVRPWVEWNAPDDTNVPGQDPAAVLACALPPGINGCGFEQPLESMYKAIKRSETSTEASYGFIRDDAHLVVVFVTDEVDCSHNPDFQSIFLPDGNQAFWSDPMNQQNPTSAVCWNAGVACTGGPDVYDECHAESYDVDGIPGVADAEAVLEPLQRYVDLLAQYQQDRPHAEVHVFGLVGVTANGSVLYQNAVADPTFQRDFGIGPGCSSASGTAVPPVRIRELGERINGGEPGLYSICAGDYSGALGDIGQRIVAWSMP